MATKTVQDGESMERDLVTSAAHGSVGFMKMKRKRDIALALGILAWVASVVFAVLLPSMRVPETGWLAWSVRMVLLYFAILLVAVVSCSVSVAAASLGRAWRSLGQFLGLVVGISAALWFLSPIFIRLAARALAGVGIPIVGLLRWHLLPLGRICEASFGMPLALAALRITKRGSQQSHAEPTSEPARCTAPEEADA